MGGWWGDTIVSVQYALCHSVPELERGAVATDFGDAVLPRQMLKPSSLPPELRPKGLENPRWGWGAVCARQIYFSTVITVLHSKLCVFGVRSGVEVIFTKHLFSDLYIQIAYFFWVRWQRVPKMFSTPEKAPKLVTLHTPSNDASPTDR